ncbi:MAG: PrsW family glutamic-type intramembrane protease, partial [Candidatus Gracilibacteria bacterium]|nr:PrsW family glutamic-type intramembrane protease [Candidatus Gracilibacteria bacterium]
VWGYIFYHKRQFSKSLAILTFLVGAVAVFPILIYKALWQYIPWLNAFELAERYGKEVISLSGIISVPMSVLIIFLLVGAIEEIAKLFAVKIVDDDEFKSVDDSMEFFIIAALGFSFTENILYFYNIWAIEGANHLFLPFIFRSSFSTFAHIMFSGIFGYYYGVAYFAKPMLQEEIRQNRRYWTRTLHKIFGWKQEKLFYQERILEGAIIAVGLHAIFNVFLELNWTFLIVPMLICGYIALDYLFTKKENRKALGKFQVGFKNRPHPKSGVHFTPRSIAKAK